MRKAKTIVLIKACLLIGALIVAIVLSIQGVTPQTAPRATVFLIDVHTGREQTQRLRIEKKIINSVIQSAPDHPFGIVTVGQKISYLVPPTTDIGTLEQYVNGLVISKLTGVIQQSRSTGMLEALQGKQLIVLGDLQVPASLHVQPLLWEDRALATQDIQTIADTVLIRDVHTTKTSKQTSWMIILLCILLILGV